MPWEADGRRWHTVERISHGGKPCRWEGAILDWVDKEVHARGPFSPTNWNHRSVVEIAAPNKSQGWFLHMMTREEWLLRLVFRVGKNTFKQGDLVRQLGIRPLNETPGLEVYSNEERVWITSHKGPWQSVTVQVHRLSEIDTPAFRAFLDKAAEAFRANLRRLATKPEDVMPWKVNGERWHLSEKGFPPGRKIQWDRGLLPRLLEVVRQVEPAIEIVWDARDAIKLRVPGVGRSWAQWRTKDCSGLDCRFIGKKGQFNLSAVEAFGATPQINGHHDDADVVRLVFLHPEHIHADQLKKLLCEHLRGFRETFAKRSRG